jgi:hypothetical protein
MKRLGIVAVLVGCTNGGSSSAAPAVEPDAPALAPAVPGACHESFALDGFDSTSGHLDVGPYALDTQGVTLCLTLDATDNIVVAHFGAGSDREQSATSSFDMTLFDGAGEPPTTFANLEYGVTKGTILEAKLVIRMRAGSGTTSVSLALFEPYE